LAERGGAQVHVADLLRGFSGKHEIALGAGTDGYLCDVARELGIPFFPIPHLVHPMKPWKDARAVHEVLRAMKQWKPDLIHGHTSKAGMVARIAGCVSSTPTVFTAHTWSFSACFSWQQQAISVPLERIAAATNCRIIAVSEANRDLAVRHRIAQAEKLVTVWNGIEDTPLRAQPGAGECPRIVMVARFAMQKDQALLIRALRSIRHDYQLDLVGDGPLRSAAEAEARASGARVNFLGERTDVAELLANAHIFVLASKWEGLPLSILEAMRAGLPVVASDVGGVAEAVTDGESGYLVPVGHEEKLRHRLQQLIADPERRAYMGVHGRRRYERDFTLPHMLGRTNAVYQSALHNRSLDLAPAWDESNRSAA
jgi:glycosyltransferase involved in cell wall biosynthesis